MPEERAARGASQRGPEPLGVAVAVIFIGVAAGVAGATARRRGGGARVVGCRARVGAVSVPVRVPVRVVRWGARGRGGWVGVGGGGGVCEGGWGEGGVVGGGGGRVVGGGLG